MIKWKAVGPDLYKDNRPVCHAYENEEIIMEIAGKLNVYEAAVVNE